MPVLVASSSSLPENFPCPVCASSCDGTPSPPKSVSNRSRSAQCTTAIGGLARLGGKSIGIISNHAGAFSGAGCDVVSLGSMDSGLDTETRRCERITVYGKSGKSTPCNAVAMVSICSQNVVNRETLVGLYRGMPLKTLLAIACFDRARTQDMPATPFFLCHLLALNVVCSILLTIMLHE